MLALLLAPIYLVVNIYVLRWAFRFIDACFQRRRTKWIKAFFTAVYAFICLTPLISFLLPETVVKRILVQVGNFGMGTFLYLVLIILMLDLIRVIMKRLTFTQKLIHGSSKIFILTGCAVIIATAGISLYGTYNARQIQMTRYSVEIPSESMSGKSMKIVLAADLHLG